jgi:hypothetical protein
MLYRYIAVRPADEEKRNAVLRIDRAVAESTGRSRACVWLGGRLLGLAWFGWGCRPEAGQPVDSMGTRPWLMILDRLCTAPWNIHSARAVQPESAVWLTLGEIPIAQRISYGDADR